MFGDDFLSSPKPRWGQSMLELFDPSQEPLTPPVLSSRMRQGDNLVLTVSQAGDYLRCPLDFKYRYILNVPGPPSATPAIGTLLHSAMQQINEALIASRELPKLEDLISQLKINWPEEGHESPKQSQRALDLALSSLERLYGQAPDNPIPLASEKRFKFKVPGAPVILTGRIDVVFGGKDGVEIRDYKSSTGATSAKKAKKQAQSSKQLTMYAMAWQELEGELPAKLSLDFIQTGFIGEVRKQPSSLETLAKSLSDATANIKAGIFEPGYRHDYCRHPQID
jgi:RecB family exonuclease